MKKQYLFLICTICFSALSIAQTPCGTDAIQKHLMETDPDYAKRFNDNNKSIREYIASHPKMNSKNKNLKSTPYIIPVVVHVMHNGEPVGSPNNPSDAQIIATIDYLNKVYAGTYPGMTDPSGGIAAGNLGVQFQLVKRTPSCGVTNGIDRVNASSLPNYTNGGVSVETSTPNACPELTLKDFARWNPSDYYNIWVVNRLRYYDSDYAGWSSFPSSPPSLDGILIRADGMVADNGLLPHEMGHALFLFHTFQGSYYDYDGQYYCTQNIDCSTDGDLVCDTDPSLPNSNCKTGINPCTGAPYSINTEYNFMSYTDCYTLFTNGQAERIQAAMNLPSRACLVASTNQALIACGVPVINFNKANVSKIEDNSSQSLGAACYRDYTYQLEIGAAPSTTAIATLSFSGSATKGVDYDVTTNGSFTNPSNQLTFNAGSTSAKTFIVRIYDDGTVEGPESAILDFNLNNGGGNAVKGAIAPTFTIVISDNDQAPGNPFTAVSSSIGSNTNPITNESCFRSSKLKNRVQYLIKPAQLNNAGIREACYLTSLKFKIAHKNSIGAFNDFTVKMINYPISNAGLYEFAYMDPAIPPAFSGDYSTVEGDNSINFSERFYWDGQSNIVINICFENTTADLLDDVMEGFEPNLFYYYSVYSNYGAGDITSACTLGPSGYSSLLPDISFTYGFPSPLIETVASAASLIHIAAGSNDNFYSGNRKLMMNISNSSADLGCVNTIIENSGTEWVSTDCGQRSAKVFSVTPGANNSTATYTASFYFNNSEFGGKDISTLKIAKTSASSASTANSSNTMLLNCTVSPYGDNGSLFTTSTAGFSTTGATRFFLTDLPADLLIDPVSSQLVCNGTATAPVTFSGLNTGITYTWTNNTPSIGLAASGIGNIPSFTAINEGLTPVIATITVVPSYINGGSTCKGLSTTFTITVNSKDAIAPSSQTICSGSTILPINVYGAVSGIVFNWTRDNIETVTGIAASGTGEISGALINTTNVPITVTFTVTSTNDACSGVLLTAKVIVKPFLQITQPTDQIVCNNEITDAVNFASSDPATIFNWTNNNSSIGLPANGTGNIAAFTATNTTNLPQIATIKLTPSSGIFAYVPNIDANTVEVVNTSTNLVVASIPVGASPSGISVTPDGKKVYVANGESNTVSAINTVTNTLEATIIVGLYPFGLAVNPDGSKVYVANSGYDSVSVINTTTNLVEATIIGFPIPFAVAVSPDGSRLYVTTAANKVSVVNTLTNIVITTISVGKQPLGLSVSPDGSKVYVANSNSNTVSVINTASNTVAATIPVGKFPYTIMTSPDGNRVYVSSSKNLSVINTATNMVEATITVGSAPIGISFSPDGTLAYALNYGSKNISVINTSTLAIENTIPLNFAPSAIGNFITGNASAFCISTAPKTFSFTVNPSPSAVANPASQQICTGTLITPILLSGNISGTTYKWTRDNTGSVTGIAASGTGNISGILTNTTSLPVTVTFTITPTANGCIGIPITATVVVNPLPNTVTITAGNPTGFCDDYTISLTANPSPAGSYTFNWSTGATTSSIDLNNNSSDGSYKVDVINTIGCSLTASYNFKKENIANSYTVLGLKDVNLGEKNIVLKGSVGNTLNNGKVVINKNSSVTGNDAIIKSSQIILKAPVTYNQLINNPVSTMLPAMMLNTKTTAGLPGFKVANNLTVTINTNYRELEIGKGANVTINGTIYGSISIKEGATVTFTQPMVNIENLSTENGKPGGNYTSIKFAGNTEMLIKNKVKLGERNRVNYQTTSTTSANNITFYMSNNVDDAEKFIIAGQDTRIAANIYMPVGKLLINGYDNNKCYMTGVYIAQDIVSDKNVTWNGGICCAAPAISSIQTILSLNKNELPDVLPFDVLVFPNPSNKDFQLQLKFANNLPLTISIRDNAGKLISVSKHAVFENSIISFGENIIASGIYFAEIRQGTNCKVVKLIKID